eukprot:m.10180 g.10180  ORF g.10180 m.10180 type:complete len:675 (-) comp3626_c0_seq1:56-2080(-)
MSSKYCVLTVSDRCSWGEAEDKSGPALVEKISEHFGVEKGEITTECVPDEVLAIRAAIRSFVGQGASLIITTGGTGITPRDVTPEAVGPMLDKPTRAFDVCLTTKSLEVTPMAMLSRPCCGVIGSTLLLTFPGSYKACKECFTFVQGALTHALDSIANDKHKISSTHTTVQASSSHSTKPSHGHVHGHDTHSHHHHHHIHDHNHKHNHDGSHTHDHGHGHTHHRSVADRDRQSKWPMINVSEALGIMLANISPLEVEDVSLFKSVGLVLAKNVVATEPHPRFPASVKDGYAVVAKDCPKVLKVASQVTAGDTNEVILQPGTCARITTGAPVPKGATAVVMVEDTELVSKTEDGEEENEIKLLCDMVEEGQDIRPIGFDIAQGETVLEKGHVIHPAELGLLATLGVPSVGIFKRASVGVISTGDELVDSMTKEENMKYGQVRDSNRHTLMASLDGMGVDVHDCGVVSDREDTLEDAIDSLCQTHDIIITSGGVSMGEKDLIKDTVARLGGKVHFGRVFMKPGKPTTFATVPKKNGKGVTLFFGLPGNPVSCLVSYHLFVTPAIRALQGRMTPLHVLHPVELGFTHTLSPRPEYHRAVFARDVSSSAEMPKEGTDGGVVNISTSGKPTTVVVSTGSQCSSRLLSMRNADVLLVFPSSKDTTNPVLPKGSVVDAIFL